MSSRAIRAIGHSAWFSRRSRTARALGAQTIAFGLLAIQQVVLIPVFLHTWGVAVYAEWLVLFFAANLTRIADFGLGYLLANRARTDAGRGRWDEYRATLRIAFAAYGLHFLVMCPSLLLVSQLVGMQELVHGRALTVPVFYGSLAALVAGALLSLGRDFLFMLYPTYDEFDRGVVLLNMQLLARVSVASALLLAGSGPLWVSIGWALVDVTMGLLLLFVDLRRRHGWGRLLPNRRDWHGLGGRRLQDWPAYAVSHAADQLLLNMPVLVLGCLALPDLQVVVFNTARTYTNLVRQFITQYGRTFGIEAAQLAIVQAEAARRHLVKANRFLGATAGVLVGCLIGLAPLIYSLWIRSADVYRDEIVLAMALPFLLTGPANACLAYLRFSEPQKAVACILSLHALTSLVLGSLSAALYGALGLAIALSLLETVFVTGFVVRRATNDLGLPSQSHLQGIVIAGLAGLSTLLIAHQLNDLVLTALPAALRQ